MAKIPKPLLRKLIGCHVGVGVITLKSGLNEVMSVEFYTSPQGELRRVANGEPLFPIKIVDEDNNGDLIEIAIKG